MWNIKQCHDLEAINFIIDKVTFINSGDLAMHFNPSLWVSKFLNNVQQLITNIKHSPFKKYIIRKATEFLLTS